MVCIFLVSLVTFLKIAHNDMKSNPTIPNQTWSCATILEFSIGDKYVRNPLTFGINNRNGYRRKNLRIQKHLILVHGCLVLILSWNLYLKIKINT